MVQVKGFDKVLAPVLPEMQQAVPVFGCRSQIQLTHFPRLILLVARRGRGDYGVVNHNG